jgi:hypothetical protein
LPPENKRNRLRYLFLIQIIITPLQDMPTWVCSRTIYFQFRQNSLDSILSITTNFCTNFCNKSESGSSISFFSSSKCVRSISLKRRRLSRRKFLTRKFVLHLDPSFSSRSFITVYLKISYLYLYLNRCLYFFSSSPLISDDKVYNTNHAWKYCYTSPRSYNDHVIRLTRTLYDTSGVFPPVSFSSLQ